MVIQLLTDAIKDIWPMLTIFLVVIISIRLMYIYNSSEKFVFYKEFFNMLFIIYTLIYIFLFFYKFYVYVFFNNDPCETCPQTIDLIEKIYYSYYSQEYSLFLINYTEDQDYDFIETYNLRNPLEVVLVRISDGSAFGYRKLQNLQDQISDPVSFTENFTNEVNDFLGDGSSSL